MSTDEIVNGLSFLGRGVDLLELDPLDVAGSCKTVKLIFTTKDQTYEEEGHTIPIGIEVFLQSSTTIEGGDRLMYNSYDFQKTFSESIEANAGIDELFEFTASKSVTNTTKETESRKETFTYLTAMHTVCVAKLELDGVRADKLQLNTDFINGVKALPLTADKKAYRSFLKKFGTHFLNTVTLGGMAYSKISSDSADRSAATSDSTTYKTDVRFSGAKGSAGVNHQNEISEQKERDIKNKVKRSSIHYVGGVGSPESVDLSWVESVEKKPVPVIGTRLRRDNFVILRVSTLLTGKLLKDEDARQLAMRRQLLDDETSSYIRERGGDEGGRIRYGHPVKLATVADNFRLYYRPDRRLSSGSKYPDLYDYNSSLAMEQGAKEAIMVVHGKGKAPGEEVCTGDPVTLEIVDAKSFVTIAAIMSTSTSPRYLGKTVPSIEFRPTSAEPRDEYSLRIRGSGQPLAGSEMKEKRRPLMSGDVIMATRPFPDDAFACWITPGFVQFGGVAAVKHDADPLLDAKISSSDRLFFVVRNVKS